ncbi:MAG: response regulator [Flavobacteriales bacterium]|nr:response regulator [Bacteroidota bacterium]MCB9240437.1 response regulator [Flavobacteriales bacterium]
MSKKKILVIEDNRDIRENLAEILELDGYDVISAEDGKIGATLAQQELPNLILCDIMMPNLDGYGVLHILSRNEDTLRIPFIFLTAKAEKADVRKGMSLGADDYIVKPFDETDLLTTVENKLRKFEHLHTSGNSATATHDLKDAFSNKVVKSYEKRESIYREGDTSNCAYKLLEGKVKLTRLSDDGKEMVIDLIKPGEYFGYWSILQDECYFEGAEALESSTLECIPKSEFLQVISSDTGIAGKFIKMLSNNLLAKEYRIVELAYNSVRKRVANALISLADKYKDDTEGPFTMAVSRETLAGIAGTSIESSIRMLSEFKSDGLVEVDKANITVLNYEKLKNAPY